MYKVFLILLVTALMGLGITGSALFLHPDAYQYATILEDTSDDGVSDMAVKELQNMDIPQVNHEPLPPPPEDPSDPSDYLAELGPHPAGGD